MATNNPANIPTGTSGKVVQGQGAGTALALSTATYPVTAGTSGNVITSNGTNFISSVFPSGPSTPTQGLQFVSLTLTSAQVKTLHASPIQILAAQGAGTVIVPLLPIIGKLTYGGNNAFVAGGGGTIGLLYGTTPSLESIFPNATLIATSSRYNNTATSGATSNAASSMENAALNLFNPAVTEISGNAANDNTITVCFIYYVLTI